MSILETIYLDHAAATPVADHVVTAMLPYLSDIFYNPSSQYAPAVQVRREYEAAKQQLAQSFGAKGDELIITAGATESINLAFHSTFGHVVTTAIEHPAVLECAKQRDHTLVQPNDKGRVSVDDIVSVIRPDTQLVSVALANNELGTLQPIRKITQAIDAIREERRLAANQNPLYVHCDGSQGFGQVDVNVARLGTDFLTLNSGKMYGPKQVGLLWAKKHISIHPIIVGGGQERGLRSGTENVSGAIGFSAAATWSANHQSAEADRLKKLRDMLQQRITSGVPESVVLGDQKHRLPGHLSISFPGIDAERLVFMLERQGIYIATGSACSANKNTASHVLTAIGLDDTIISGSIRLTLGKRTTEQSVERASADIITAVKSEYARMKKV